MPPVPISVAGVPCLRWSAARLGRACLRVLVAESVLLRTAARKGEDLRDIVLQKQIHMSTDRECVRVRFKQHPVFLARPSADTCKTLLWKFRSSA
eukprot:6310927-Alexandrium_andersonii.AAC.1